MISAILLAAGESRRMGAFKPLLPFRNSTIIESCLANLRAARIDDLRVARIDDLRVARIGELIVVLGHRAPELISHLANSPARLIINENYRAGMTTSVQAGLAQVNRDSRAIMLALVDQPHIPTEIINQLIEAYNKSGALIIKPQYQGRSGHPIIIDLSIRDEIMQLAPDEGLHQVTRAHRNETMLVPVDSSSVIEDLDTAEDYARLMKAEHRKLEDILNGKYDQR